MGVSLERVQFKFASIIGELCNDPDVLSQFAVWLDLRLSEYKLKGNISLDCSGEEPSPCWLSGLKMCRICGGCRLASKQNESPDHLVSESFECARLSHLTSKEKSVLTLPIDTGFVKTESEILTVDSESESDKLDQELSVLSSNHESLEIKTESRCGRKVAQESTSVLSSEQHLPSIADDPNLLSVIAGFELPSVDNGQLNTDKCDNIVGPQFDENTNHSNMYLENNSSVRTLLLSKRTLYGSIQNSLHTSHSNYYSTKLSNAEKQKLYRAKMKETMTEEQKQRAKVLAKQRYLRWKSKRNGLPVQ